MTVEREEPFDADARARAHYVTAAIAALARDDPAGAIDQLSYLFGGRLNPDATLVAIRLVRYRDLRKDGSWPIDPTLDYLA